jgi:hypothetical protein
VLCARDYNADYDEHVVSKVELRESTDPKGFSILAECVNKQGGYEIENRIVISGTLHYYIKAH